MDLTLTQLVVRTGQYRVDSGPVSVTVVKSHWDPTAEGQTAVGEQATLGNRVRKDVRSSREVHISTSPFSALGG